MALRALNEEEVTRLYLELKRSACCVEKKLKWATCRNSQIDWVGVKKKTFVFNEWVDE